LTELVDLRRAIETRKARLGVIGLGYVGLPVACLFADAGFDVLGVEVKPERVERINARTSPIEGNEPGLAALLARVVGARRLRATTDYGSLTDCDVVMIGVETPVDDEDHKPRYESLRAALKQLGPALKNGALVIVESTLAPGTMDGLVKPLLEKSSGKCVNEEFYIGHCPERVMPGKLLANLRGVSRVCGGETPETAETMVALYRHVVKADLDVADCLTAELVKTAENAYRDVNIAFANEVALVCEALGGDVWKVRELVNKSPGRNMLLPGAGVGGHCVPKDPWLLIADAGDKVKPRLIPAARAVNDGMPLHVADLAVDALKEAGVKIAGAKVTVLGYAYLENSDDTRNSPSEPLVARLREQGVSVVVHDPFVREYQGALEKALQGSDAVVVMVAHDEYRALDLDELRGRIARPVLIDGRRVFSAEQAEAAGWAYRGVGSARQESIEVI
jgi:UDP-N-acetyl-D-mannosaminuronic acid dehydrogenase